MIVLVVLMLLSSQTRQLNDLCYETRNSVRNLHSLPSNLVRSHATPPIENKEKTELFARLNRETNSLLTCGDISSQPGPTPDSSAARKPRRVAFPCSVCAKGVTKASKAISCDTCDRWTHIRCTPCISAARYDRSVATGEELHFECDACTLASLPFGGEDDVDGVDTADWGARAAPSLGPYTTGLCCPFKLCFRYYT